MNIILLLKSIKRYYRLKQKELITKLGSKFSEYLLHRAKLESLNFYFYTMHEKVMLLKQLEESFPPMNFVSYTNSMQLILKVE